MAATPQAFTAEDADVPPRIAKGTEKEMKFKRRSSAIRAEGAEFKRSPYQGTKGSVGTCRVCGAPVVVKKTSEGVEYFGHREKDRRGFKPHEPKL